MLKASEVDVNITETINYGKEHVIVALFVEQEQGKELEKEKR
jgi:hypothetical protein